MQYLSGGEQTTINSTITELFPALAFNTGMKFNNATDLEEYIDNLDLNSPRARKSFVNNTNIKAAYSYINKMDQIRPSMKKTKLENAVGILNYLYKYNKSRPIKQVVWGYREKPRGVPYSHAGDIFLIHRNDKIAPKIVGISLKAGTAKSKEPKLNSYVGTTLRKSAWKRAYPRAIDNLKDKLWKEVYSQIPGLPLKGSKKVDKNNWLTLSNTRQKPNPILVDAVLNLFQTNPKQFDALYVKMNKICREHLVEMINGNLNATKSWIREEFRLQEQNVDVPMVLVKAIGKNANSSSTDPLRDILPKATKVKAYLKSGSVQEWFIDVMANGREKLTLSMTIRSDSEYRKSKQKGKLGAYMMLKLLYRG
tara:strand:+ start:285 stop:1382 length:1098 start_codon:yes stop_codon:yes gene_type:complete